MKIIKTLFNIILIIVLTVLFTILSYNIYLYIIGEETIIEEIGYPILNNIAQENTETKIEAEKFVGASSGDITKVIKRGGSINGYMFSYYGEELKRKVYRCNKEVEMCDDNWNIVKSFISKKDVYEYLNLKDHHKLNEAIKNKKKYNGYYWRHKDEFKINS